MAVMYKKKQKDVLFECVTLCEYFDVLFDSKHSENYMFSFISFYSFCAFIFSLRRFHFCYCLYAVRSLIFLFLSFRRLNISNSHALLSLLFG